MGRSSICACSGDVARNLNYRPGLDDRSTAHGMAAIFGLPAICV
jgi:hypothetical protein